jgi:predicted glutamine amidotransferase
MCRWLAYSGSPIPIEEVLFKPAHSLVIQSLKARNSPTTMTNGDGIGVGWYGRGGDARLYRSTNPAWNDRNLKELAAEVESKMFLAHVRSSTGGAVQQTNCHPFRFGKWLFMHNGEIHGWLQVKRDLAMAVDPALFTSIEGTTDSELMFYIALTFGLEKDPPGAVAKMVGLVEKVARSHGIDKAIQMTLAIADGVRIWFFRYASPGCKPGSLYFSTDIRELRKLYPDVPRFKQVADETRMVVSEPFVDLPGAWQEVKESTWGVIQEGEDAVHDFAPV